MKDFLIGIGVLSWALSAMSLLLSMASVVPGGTALSGLGSTLNFMPTGMVVLNGTIAFSGAAVTGGIEKTHVALLKQIAKQQSVPAPALPMANPGREPEFATPKPEPSVEEWETLSPAERAQR